MATTTRPDSLLPTIKCSTCAQEIDLMSLADHICTPPSKPRAGDSKASGSDRPHLGPDSTSQLNYSPLQDPAIQFLPTPNAPPKSVGYLRSKKNVPPRIDAFAANQPFLQVAGSSTPLSAYSNYSDGQSTAPFSPNTQITTPSSMSSHKPTLSSTSPTPPSPKLAPNLESAFPLLAPKLSLSNGANGMPMNNMYAPLSPRPQGGAEVLQRMNTIAPGPFGHRVRPSQEPLPYAPTPEVQGVHSRNGSVKQQFRNEQGRQHFRKASSVSSVQSHRSHNSQQSVNSQIYQRRHESAVSNRARPSEAIDRFLDELQSEPSGSSIKSPELTKAGTFPEVTEDRQRPKIIGAGLPPPPSAPHYRTEFSHRGPMDERRPETSAGVTRAGYGGFSASLDPAVQNPRPSPSQYRYNVSTPTDPRRSRSRTTMQPSNPNPVPHIPPFEQPRPSPLPPVNNMSLPNVLRAQLQERTPILAGDSVARSRSRTITRTSESNNGMRPLMPAAPAFPTLNRLMTDQPMRSEMYHSPSDSASSGYASTGRSTPPSSVGSSISRSGSTDSTNERHWDGGALKTSAFLQPNSLQRPRMPAANDDLYNPPESPVDPAFQNMRLSKDSAGENGSRNIITDSQPRRAPDMRPFARAATAASAAMAFSKPSKGNCAACQQPIYGKSVKAAGGKPTGRYHKECFSCKTCQAPFPTAEFYVLNNAPYCGRHYHELNGSLCAKCDSGIEGQYLQTDRREKYHAHCFSCVECRVRLTEDYFEVNGQAFCERHAYSMTRSRGPQYGNGGGLGVHGAYLVFRGIKFHVVPSNNHASFPATLPLLASHPDAGPPFVQPVIPAASLEKWARKSEPMGMREDVYMSLVEGPIRRAWLYHMYLTPNFDLLTVPAYIISQSKSSLIRAITSRELRSSAEKALLQYKPIISEHAIYLEAEEAFKALSTYLKEQMDSGKAPTTLLDAAVFSYVYLLLELNEHVWADRRLVDVVRKFKALREHKEIIERNYFTVKPPGLWKSLNAKAMGG
ncbi:hypothetical protein EG327_006471 [Venturia inaequalis]|uniref:LIM zinc-binding domain-containing protein n=1 Tax=Venturia inaequalis TaxID=5025 RepID=A0A8H3VSR7_VENIN|nr:hypothetical protein EG327_006471 [Venturia inaequalis]